MKLQLFKILMIITPSDFRKKIIHSGGYYQPPFDDANYFQRRITGSRLVVNRLDDTH